MACVLGESTYSVAYKKTQAVAFAHVLLYWYFGAQTLFNLMFSFPAPRSLIVLSMKVTFTATLTTTS